MKERTTPSIPVPPETKPAHKRFQTRVFEAQSHEIVCACPICHQGMVRRSLTVESSRPYELVITRRYNGLPECSMVLPLEEIRELARIFRVFVEVNEG